MLLNCDLPAQPFGLSQEARLGMQVDPAPEFGIADVPLGGLGATLFIETIQHFMPGRTSSLLDVLANSLGCAIGWVLGLVVLRVVLKPTQTLKESA